MREAQGLDSSDY